MMLSNVCVYMCVNNNVIQFFSYIYFVFMFCWPWTNKKGSVSDLYLQYYFFSCFLSLWWWCWWWCSGENIKKRVFIYGEFRRSSFGILLSIYLWLSHISLFCCSFGCLVCYISCFFSNSNLSVHHIIITVCAVITSAAAHRRHPRYRANFNLMFKKLE